MRHLFFLAGCFLYCSALAQHNGARENFYFDKNLDQRDALIAKRLHDRVISLSQKDSFSGVVLLAYRGKIIYQGAFGLASKEYNVPVNFDTRFDLASMTKTFTGVAVAQLAQHGKLKFTDPVVKYLP